MSNNIKIPGVYMIRNELNGKVYIGESSDIRERWRKHRWSAVTDKSNLSKHEKVRPIIVALRADGLVNFSFEVLCTGDQYKDLNTRLLAESRYIAKYNADLPEYGYNITSGYTEDRESLFQVRKNKDLDVVSRHKRAKAVIEYDIKTGLMILYFGGAKAWGMHRGYGKDVASHTVKRGSLIAGRYYLIYADKEERAKQLEIIRVRKCENTNRPHKSQVLARNKFDAYKAAVDDVDANW